MPVNKNDASGSRIQLTVIIQSRTPSIVRNAAINPISADLLISILTNAPFWQLKRLVTLSTYRHYINKFVYLFVCKAVRWPCGVCDRGVGSNSIQCISCQKWVHKKCSGIKGIMVKVIVIYL